MNSVQKFKRKMIVGTLSGRDRNQMRIKALMKRIVTSILKFIRLDERNPVPARPCYAHLEQVIKLYEDWKNFSCFYNIYNYKYFGKQTMRYLLKLCHYWWIHDPNILMRVMFHYTDCFSEYTQILYGVIEDRATWKTIFEKRKWLKPTTRSSRHNNNTPLSYFLENYNFISRRMDGKCFADLPAPFPFHVSEYYTASTLCCQWGHSSKFLLLLQYGASISGFCDKESEAYRCLDMLHLAVDIACIFLRCMNTDLSNSQTSELSRDFGKRIQCCIFLIRAAPQLPVYSDIDVITVIEKANQLQMAGYQVDVESRLIHPCPLKHLCRLLIRSILKRFVRLPHGISALPVTQCLKDYLNLLQD